MNTLIINSMIKKALLFALFCPFAFALFGQKTETSKNDEFLESLTRLTTQQLFDTARYYLQKNSFDTSLICFNLFASTAVIKDTDIEMQKRIIIVYIYIGNIYAAFSDYKSAYDIYLRALSLGEKYNIESYKGMIYNNIGAIYHLFDKYDMAKSYYVKSLDAYRAYRDSLTVALLSNLGLIDENIDNAFSYLDKALQISKQHDNKNIESVYASIAATYQKIKRYDSAYHYYKLALSESKKNNNLMKKTEFLNSLGAFFLETNQNDSALFYINLSNSIAETNGLYRTVANNYLVLSKIEAAKGNIKKELEYFKRYTHLKDSIFNATKLGDINQSQRLYEVSITNRQIEDLIIEKQVKERTIKYQKILLITILVAFFFAIGAFVFIFILYKKLRNSNIVLVDKNVEIFTLRKEEAPITKNRDKKEKVDVGLLNKILDVMENSLEIYKQDFDLDRLAKLADLTYPEVSTLINSVLKKNFYSFVNDYRIREAQRILSDPNYSKKYTIETISKNVGFKTRSAFYNAFKEITGVAPKFYLKTITTNTTQPTKSKKKGNKNKERKV